MSSLGHADISASEMDEKISEAVAAISVTFDIDGCRLESIYMILVSILVSLKISGKEEENSTHCKSNQYNPPAEMLHHYHLLPLHQYSFVQPAHPTPHKHTQ